MGSFSKMTAFSPGYFRAISRWLLNERRDVAARVAVIGAEMSRIGYIRCVYQRHVTGEGEIRASYKRIGFEVTVGSSLARLSQAYIAAGGNPWDISSFMYPDETRIVEETSDGTLVVTEEYPAGGVVAPGLDTDYGPTNVTQPGKTGYEADPGGWIGHYKDGLDPRYYPGRVGGRLDPGIAGDENVKSLTLIRGWTNQSVKEKLQDIEWRIIKLADLREQLQQERDSVLVQAFGGVLRGLPEELDEEQFDRGLMVQNIIQALYHQLFVMSKNPSDGVQAYRANPETGFTPEYPKTEPSEVVDQMS